MDESIIPVYAFEWLERSTSKKITSKRAGNFHLPIGGDLICVLISLLAPINGHSKKNRAAGMELQIAPGLDRDWIALESDWTTQGGMQQPYQYYYGGVVTYHLYRRIRSWGSCSSPGLVGCVDPNLHLVPCCYSPGHHHLSTPIPAECSRLHIIVHHLLVAGQSFYPCNGSPGHSGLIIG